MRPIQVVDSVAAAAAVAAEEDRDIAHAANQLCGARSRRRMSVWNLLALCMFAFVLVQLVKPSFTKHRTHDSSGVPLDKSRISHAPYYSPKQEFTGSVLEVQAQLREYYKGAGDLPLAFGATARDQERFALNLARRITRKRQQQQQQPTTGSKFVIGLVSDGQLTMRDCDKSTSSITNDYYLQLLRRTLGPLFESVAQLELEIREIKLQPSVSPVSLFGCLDAHLGGDEVDLVHIALPHLELGDDANEELMARALRGKLVHFISVTYNTGSGGASSSESFNRLVRAMPNGTVAWLQLEEGMRRVLNYKTKTWGAVGDGLHTQTRRGELGVVWRNWTPGPLAQQFLADVVSTGLLRALQLSQQQEGQQQQAVNDNAGEESAAMQCFSAHSKFGQDGIQPQLLGKWTRVTNDPTADAALHGECSSDAIDEERMWEQYIQASYSSNGGGDLVFAIPASTATTNTGDLYVCCCCSSLCVTEQLPKAKFTLQHGGESSSLPAHNHRSECWRVARNVPTPNELTVSIVGSPEEEPRVRISRVIFVPNEA